MYDCENQKYQKDTKLHTILEIIFGRRTFSCEINGIFLKIHYHTCVFSLRQRLHAVDNIPFFNSLPNENKSTGIVLSLPRIYYFP